MPVLFLGTGQDRTTRDWMTEDYNIVGGMGNLVRSTYFEPIERGRVLRCPSPLATPLRNIIKCNLLTGGQHNDGMSIRTRSGDGSGNTAVQLVTLNNRGEGSSVVSTLGWLRIRYGK